MKKLFFYSLLVINLHYLSAQIINVNPDPNGEPWYVGGLRIPGEEEMAKIPTVILSQQDLQRQVNTLPTHLDNTTQPYFRPIFSQSNGSCAQSSGVAYNFTYEINRERGTSAAIAANQFPSHYTYDFLNNGSGDNGSWYTDGWDIIKANGCPDLPTYGGDLDTGGPQRWLSGYQNYESGMNNRVKEYFAIDVSTPDGLITLKHWLYDHLENASTGSLVNFSAGISNIGFNMTSDNIVTSWGYIANHAMTFVGWDDNISYDYNNDGQITNNIDINNDGVVDMRDWERGALIMVNSWGTSWGNGGKAYVMYKLLAEDMIHGGIVGKRVFGLRVKASQTPQLKMRVKISHNQRNKIKISAGIASDINAASPEFIIDFPLFNRQGGAYSMQGISNNPLELSLDISRLLSYVPNGTPAKYFLIVNEDDPTSDADGTIYDFAIVDQNNQIYTCTQHNVNINNNADTVLSISTSIDYDGPQITTTQLTPAQPGQTYSYNMEAANGSPVYQWKILQQYNENTISENYPAVTSQTISTDNDDDGYGMQTLDFDFPFYGQYYNQVYILTDGSITFEPGFSYLRTDSAIKSHKMIGVFASDLMIYPADGDGIFYEGDTNHATFRWKTSLYGNQSADIDVAVTLYPDGKIKFYYGNNITTNLNWAAGISNGNGSARILSLSGNSTPANHQFELNPEPYPNGMLISENGLFQGTAPNEINTWPVTFKVTDNNDVSSIKTLNFETQTNGLKDENLISFGCYPNPATDYVVFSYQLKNQSNIKINIYDLQGKPVAALLNQPLQSAGNHQLIWHPQLSKGMYIYRLQTNQGNKSGKLIIK